MNTKSKNLDDDTIEGFEATRLKLDAVQFHPEATPGPEEALVILVEWKQ